MLQIDHVYEFLYQEIFKDFELWHLPGGVPKIDNIDISDISIFTQKTHSDKKIFFYDQEPFINDIADPYIDVFDWQSKYEIEEIADMFENNTLPYNISADVLTKEEIKTLVDISNRKFVFLDGVLVTSEHSIDVDSCIKKYNFKSLYYFFHGFAALDWYRGYYALNYNKSIVKQYNYDFISFNRIINNDRSYRIYFISLLKELELLEHGLVSFGVTDDEHGDWRDEVMDAKTKLSERARHHVEEHLVDINKLVIDHHEIHGSASADILRTIERVNVNNDTLNTDAFWHVVTETVFYYPKLHLTEKIFKPIASKQPFMLMAAPGNLAYLKSYGFKTFDSVIDETYDTIQDPDLRTQAVVKQLYWYCNLSPGEKTDVIKQLEPIIQHNFDHFYGEFRHIITRELLDNTKTLFQSIGYNDSHINYTNIHHVLTY